MGRNFGSIWSFRSILLLSPFFLVGCFLQQPTNMAPEKLVEVELDIFAARGFLGGSDYEHYTLKDGLLWRECGSIPRKMIGSSNNLSEKTLEVRQKRLESLTAIEQAPIVRALNEVKEGISKVGIKSLPSPQSVKSMRDGGLFELKSGRLELATTIDIVEDGKTREAKKLRTLFETLRGVGPLICESQTFFGIGRR